MHKHRLERVLVVNDGLRAARPDHRQGHPEVDRAPDRLQGRARASCASAPRSASATDTEERVEALVEAGVDVIVVDTAHGHSQGVLDRVRWVKTQLPAGRRSSAATSPPRDGARRRWSSTAPTASRSASARARSARRASSPASACRRSPRSQNVAEALAGTGVPLIADGGIRYSGDIAKAIAAGAHA